MYVYLKASINRLPEDPAHFQYFLLTQPGVVRAFVSRRGYIEIVFNREKTSKEKILEVIKAFDPKIEEEGELEKLEPQRGSKLERDKTAFLHHFI